MPPIAFRKSLVSALGRAVLVSAGTGMAVVASPAQAQISIVDVDSYANAVRTLKMIDQQVRQLQNEAQMLLRMDRQLGRIGFPEVPALLDTLGQIDRLMTQAQTVNLDVDGLEDKLRTLYPRSFDQLLRRDQRLAAAKARFDASSDAFRRTMLVQSRIVENVRGDAEALSGAIARSQAAEGSLAAQQATNQLLALTAKQQFQLQQLMAAQFRSDAIEKQRQLTQAEEARAATKKFLGTGSAYTPR
jgi:P-type conjugative transfer protein TrbJ